MTMELTQHTNSQDTNDKETLYLLGGAALVVFGAGLILSTPIIRRALGGANVMSLVQGVVPDFERYMKLRSM
jgi:hypothetical protein